MEKKANTILNKVSQILRPTVLKRGQIFHFCPQKVQTGNPVLKGADALLREYNQQLLTEKGKKTQFKKKRPNFGFY